MIWPLIWMLLPLEKVIRKHNFLKRYIHAAAVINHTFAITQFSSRHFNFTLAFSSLPHVDHILDALKSAANGCGIHKALWLLGDEPLVWCGSPHHPPLTLFLFWCVSSNRADCLMFLGFLVSYLLEKDYHYREQPEFSSQLSPQQ